MASETIVVGSNGKWTLSGTEYDGNYGYRAKNDSGSSNYERLRRVKESYNTPNMWRKVTEYVQFKPRSGRYPTYPRKPVLHYPSYPFLRPRRPNQSNRSWNLALNRHNYNIVRYKLVVSRRTAEFEARMRKFNIRLAKYEKFVKKMRDGVPKKVRKRNKGILPEWHPFSQSEAFDTGTLGTWTTNWRQWVYGTPVRGAWQTSGDITAKVDIVANGSWPSANLYDMQAKATTAANSIALNRFHEKLSGESIHLGQVIAERAQSIGLLTSSVARLVNFLKYFTPKAAVRATVGLLSKRGGRQISDDYLAFQFGAKPLMEDVKGAAELVAHLMVDKLDNYLISVTGSATKAEEQKYTFTKGGMVFEVTQRVQVKVRYVCEYGVDNILTREMSNLGLINPAEILWELTPWSFVVDWVLPVGNYIRHLTNDMGVVFLRGTQATRTVMTTTVKLNHRGVDPNTPAYWNSEEWNDFDWTRTRGTITKTRVLLNEAPKVQLPSFKNPFSTTHVLEGLALLYQKSKFK